MRLLITASTTYCQASLLKTSPIAYSMGSTTFAKQQFEFFKDLSNF